MKDLTVIKQIVTTALSGVTGNPFIQGYHLLDENLGLDELDLITVIYEVEDELDEDLADPFPDLTKMLDMMTVDDLCQWVFENT